MPRSLLLALVFAVCVLPCRGQEKEVLQTTGWGSLSGKVTFDGDLPEVVSLVPEIQKLDNPVDKACCMAAPAKQRVKPNWTIDAKTKGIANVAVWIKPPAGKVFPIHDMDKKRKDTVVLDQPFCSFVPHMVALYPDYHNGKELVPTGQKFIIKNSSIVSHNVRSTVNLKFNEAFNVNQPAKSEREFALKPQPLPITLQCDFHKFMTGYVCVFDHPYFAITKADGSFTMPRVPAGAEVTIMAWHEEVYLNALAVGGKQITLKEGKNEYDFSIKGK
jgi:hypothetical protein